MEVFIFWVLFSIIPGAIASAKGRSFIGYFLLSLIISPLIALIVAVCLKDKEKENIKSEVAELRSQVSASQPEQDSGDSANIVCPHCSAQIPASAKFCPECGTPIQTPPSKVEATKSMSDLYFH